MSDFEDIQRLLRLKRHEQPPEGFVDDFVRQFQQRQRQELLQQSARGLLWERVTTYFEGLLEPKWRWAGATAVALMTVFMVFKPGDARHQMVAKTGTDKAVTTVQGPISDAEVERYLISKHFDGGLGNEHGLAQESQDAVPVYDQKLVLPTSYIRQDLEVK